MASRRVYFTNRLTETLGGYLWLAKFEDVLRRLTEETTADTIRMNEFWTVVRVRVTVFPSFIVTEISDALESYHDGVDSGKNGVGIENADGTISSRIK